MNLGYGIEVFMIRLKYTSKNLKPVSRNELPESGKELVKEIEGAVFAADYEKALKLSEQGLNDFPDLFVLQAKYASLLADYASIIGADKGDRLQFEAVLIMEKLVEQLEFQPDIEVVKLKSEYYWQTGQHLRQYELGAELEKSGMKGFYPRGVGAAWYALHHLRFMRVRLSKQWAKKSIEAWKEMHKVDSSYYNGHVHKALAYGILGQFKKMEQSLDKAAKLSGKKAGYVEFEGVRQLISEQIQKGLLKK